VGADELDRRHERIGQYHRPQKVKAELRACLRVGGDAARIIIGCASDEARAELLEESDRTQPSAQLQRIDPSLMLERWPN